MARRVSPGGGRKMRGRRAKPSRGPPGNRAIGGMQGKRLAYHAGAEKLNSGDAPGAVEYFAALSGADPGEPLWFAGLGAAQLEAGSVKEAVGSLEKAMELGDDDAGVHFNLGSAHSKLGMYEDAMACYRRALDRKPDMVQALSNMAYVYKQWNMWEDSLRAADAALRLEPGDYYACLSKGAALFSMHRYAEAAAAFEGAAAAEPRDAGARARVGSALLFAGDEAGARECFEAALRLDPSNTLCLLQKGGMLARAGKHDLAYEAYSSMAEGDRTAGVCASMALSLALAHGGQEPGAWHCEAVGLAELAIEMDHHHAGGHYAMARLLEAAGEDSGKHRRAAERLDPEHGGDPFYADLPEPEDRQISEGMAEIAAGRRADGLSMLESLARDKPDFADGRAALGAALGMCGRAEEGAAELREALRLGAEEATVYSSMSAVYDDAGDGEKAGECRLRAESAGSRRLIIARARERMDEGRPAEALKEAGRALQLDPDDAEANTLKGAALARMGRFRASIKPLQKAALARPDSAHAHMHLGESLASDGDFERALRHFEAAVRLEPGDAGGYRGKGNVLSSLGRFREAYEAYERAAGMAPAGPTYAYMAMALFDLHSQDGAPAAGQEWHARAMSLADEAIKMDAGCAYAYYAKSRLLSASGDEPGAQKNLLRAGELEPDIDWGGD